MKIVVGLGNPGSKYDGTRHNVGFDVLTELNKRQGNSIPKVKFQGSIVEFNLQGEKILLLAPQTFMNRSGQSVREAVKFYDLDVSDLMVICDDLNLPVAKIRVRTKGSAGGQKGLANIIQQLGTQEFPRLRIGIGSAPERWDVADYVLGKFNKDEKSEIAVSIQLAADAVETWIGDGIERCMNRYN